MQLDDIYSIMGNMKGKHMIDTNRRVYVYFNLHKKVWSVRQDGRIVEHTKYIMLKDARFLVGQAGRKKVLREKRKMSMLVLVVTLLNVCLMCLIFVPLFTTTHTRMKLLLVMLLKDLCYGRLMWLWKLETKRPM